jgi:hypothetical protein
MNRYAITPARLPALLDALSSYGYQALATHGDAYRLGILDGAGNLALISISATGSVTVGGARRKNAEAVLSGLCDVREAA